MSKLLRVRDYLLLSAALAGELFEEVRLVGGIVPELMKGRYGFVPPNFKKKSYATAVSKMLSTDEIEKVVGSDGLIYLQLTSSGKSNFKRRFPLASLIRKEWDGYFMEVIFDIPEIDKGTRNQLRNKLKELGFGMLQESVWISPYHFEEDLREFLVNRNLSEQVFVLEAKAIRAGKLKNMVEKIWQLDNIRSLYQEVIERSNKAFNLEVGKREDEVKKIWELYLFAIKSDPNLPDDLEITPIKRKEASNALSKLVEFN